MHGGAGEFHAWDQHASRRRPEVVASIAHILHRQKRAHRIMVALYGSLAASPGDIDPVEALRAAQLAVARHSPGADWAAFHVVSR